MCINTESMTIYERSAKNLGSNRLTMDTNLYAKPRVKKTAEMSRRSNWQSRLLTCTLICLISSLTQGLIGIQAATFTRQSDLESSTYLYEGKTKYNHDIRQVSFTYEFSSKLSNLKKGFFIIKYFHYNSTKIKKTLLFALIF